MEVATEKLGDAADVAKEKASGAAEQAKSRAQQEIDTRSTQAGEEVSSFAEALRTTSDKLREEGKDGPAKAADRVAEQAQKVGGYLTDADGDKILSDVEDFARRKPWVVLAGGVVVGLAAARFLKASSAERSISRSEFSGPSRQSRPGGTGNGHEPGRAVGSGPSAPPATPAPAPTPTATPAPVAPSPSGGLQGTVPPPVPPAGG
jgi:uncharacterized protein YjbJ (UPF0337 family)